MPDELIVLLDEKTLQPIGDAPKLASHHATTPLHLAFSVWVFNDKGELLLTKRASSKKVWPGVWTNSFCGHPLPGETISDAIFRRARFELGIIGLENIEEKLPDYRYVTPPYIGIIENEFCPVFFASLPKEGLIKPNPTEVDSFQFVKVDDLRQMIDAEPGQYSYWFKDQFIILAEKGFL